MLETHAETCVGFHVKVSIIAGWLESKLDILTNVSKTPHYKT